MSPRGEIAIPIRELDDFPTGLVKHSCSRLEAHSAVHLVGLASALIDPMVRDDSWEAIDILDRAREEFAIVRRLCTEGDCEQYEDLAKAIETGQPE